MKRLSRRFQADVFIKRLLHRGHEFWDETNLLGKEMLYNSARFLLVFFFIHDNDKKTAVYSSSLFSTDLDSNGPIRVRFCGGHVYELFVLEHILENSRLYFPLLFTDCLQLSRNQWYLILFFSASQWFVEIRHDRTNLRNQCVFRFNTEPSINGVTCPVSMWSKLQRSVARDKSYCK